jgi:hypothetical protein
MEISRGKLLTGNKFTERFRAEDPDAVGIYEFARQTGYSYTHVYTQVRVGKLEARKVKGMWLIPCRVLKAALTQLVPDGAGEEDRNDNRT